MRLPAYASSSRSIAAIILLGTCASTFAAQPASGKHVSVGVSYLPPPYQASTKFRTPEAIDIALAESLAKTARATPKTVRTDAAQGGRLLADGKIDVLVSNAAVQGGLPASILAVPTGYMARPMAIMRTDTAIKTAEQLRGRKVCVAEGGVHVGTVSSKYGAIEIVSKAPADSLLAVRIGACDAAVHDSALLEELIKLPEWKKFSASLHLGPPVEKTMLVRRADAVTLNAVKESVAAWQKTDFIKQETKRMVRHIAFEVYLDQNVPDCH